MNLLAGDIGGTKTILAIFSNEDKLCKLYQKYYQSKEWSCLEQILEDFFKGIPKEINKPKSACLAVAGQVNDISTKITNLSWNINKNNLSNLLNLKTIEIINDFSVLIYGLQFLNPTQQVLIQGDQKNVLKDGIVSVVGAGTGLGISRGLIAKNKIISIASEGGHKEFSARTNKEWEFSVWLRKKLELNRLSIERVVSGTGLGHIANWRLSCEDAISHPLRNSAEKWFKSRFLRPDLPDLASKYASEGDPIMNEALQIWLSAYGSAVGDLALQELPCSGIWIAGGTASKQLAGIKSKTFLESMKNKGRFESFVENLPLFALIDPEAGLFSAACRARMMT